MIPQSQWRKIVDESEFSIPAAADAAGIDYAQFLKYLNLKQTPRRERYAKIAEVMQMFNDKPKATFHPSFGYATEEQIKKLNGLGLGAERDQILRQIELQSKKKGKKK